MPSSIGGNFDSAPSRVSCERTDAKPARKKLDQVAQEEKRQRDAVALTRAREAAQDVAASNLEDSTAAAQTAQRAKTRISDDPNRAARAHARIRPHAVLTLVRS